MKAIIYQYCFWIPNLTKLDYHQIISYSIAQSALMYPLLKHNLNTTRKTGIEPEIQNRLLTLKPGNTTRIRTDEERAWDKTGSVIAPNDCSRSCNVLNEKGNLIVRNHRHLIPTNEKFIVKHDYENIIEPSQITKNCCINENWDAFKHCRTLS